MPTFRTPTQQQGVNSGDPLFSRYKVPVGLSVIRVNGQWVTTPFPWLGDIQDQTEGQDFYLGGRDYVVTDERAAELSAAGYTVEDEAGYGVDPYGSGGYGA